MTRWSESDLVTLQARQVGNGIVSRQAVPIVARMSKTLRPKGRYTARPEWFDGVRFDSQAELRRYKDLRLMQAAGEIEGLAVHPRFDLHACGALLGFIELDFEYLTLPARVMVYEDVKDAKKNSSTRTPIYRWKRRHLAAEHRIEITEVA